MSEDRISSRAGDNNANIITGKNIRFSDGDEERPPSLRAEVQMLKRDLDDFQDAFRTWLAGVVIGIVLAVFMLGFLQFQQQRELLREIATLNQDVSRLSADVRDLQRQLRSGSGLVP